MATLCSINVNGMAELSKRQRVFHSLLALNYDIYALQETHLSSLELGKTWEKEWGGRALWSPGTNRSSGTALLFNPRCKVDITDHNSDLAGRVVSAKLLIDNVSFQLINVYAPNDHSDRERFFDELWRFTFHNTDAIVVGDFNCVPDIGKDKFGGDACFGDRAIAQLHAFTSSLGLEDIYRIKNPTGRLFTWFNGNHTVGCRLDRFYFTSSLATTGTRPLLFTLCVLRPQSNYCAVNPRKFKPERARHLEIQCSAFKIRTFL